MNTEVDKNLTMEEEKPQEVPVVDCNTSTPAAESSTIVPEEEVKKDTTIEVQVTPATVQPTEKKVEMDVETASKDKLVSKVYNYGSCEMDQFWLPGQRSETRRPYLNSFVENIPVIQIACGSLHVLLLTKEGLVYTSGLNDDGALGRLDETATDEESDKKSKLISLPIRVNMISAGDSHSVAANSELGVCFQWGAYRNTEKCNLAPPTRLPTRVGVKEFEKKTFKKVLSGTQHTLVLTNDGEVFGWGDPDLGVIGRAPRTRHGYENALKVGRVTQHKAIDIATGGRHSFIKRAIKKGDTTTHAWFSWGLNNFGQLGLELEEDAQNSSVFFEPTQMNFFNDLDVKEICGGESHSLVLLTDGTVYAFGRNDIGQFGLGDTKSTHPVYGQIKEVNNKPLKIDTFPESAQKIENIWSGSNYCYARDASGQCFSWGFGSNFVLGNRKDEDEDEFKPFTIPRDFFKNEEVPSFFSLGSQHVSYLVVEDLANNDLKVPQKLLLDAPVEFLPQHMRPSTTALAKELKAAQALEKQEQAVEKKKAQEEVKKAKQEADEKKKLEKETAEKEKEKEKNEAKLKVDEVADKKKPKTQEPNSRKNSKEPVSKKSKSKSASRERSIKKVSVSASASTSKGKGTATSGSSNKKKIPDSDHVKVSQVKNTKTIKKESTSSKKK